MACCSAWLSLPARFQTHQQPDYDHAFQIIIGGCRTWSGCPQSGGPVLQVRAWRWRRGYGDGPAFWRQTGGSRPGPRTAPRRSEPRCGDRCVESFSQGIGASPLPRWVESTFVRWEPSNTAKSALLKKRTANAIKHLRHRSELSYSAMNTF